MSVQGVIAVVIMGVGFVLLAAAMVSVLRWLLVAARKTSVSSSMTWAQRRRASARLRSGRPVPAGEIDDVSRIAVQVASQHRLALIPAATTVVAIGAALLPLPFWLAHVLMAVVALLLAATAATQLGYVHRARRFLEAHPDPASTSGGLA